MVICFDEIKLKEALGNIQDSERELFVNEFLDLVGIKKLEIGNANLTTATQHLELAITIAKTTPLSSQENQEIQKYLQRIGM
jgi:hypothetical protein